MGACQQITHNLDALQALPVSVNTNLFGYTVVHAWSADLNKDRWVPGIDVMINCSRRSIEQPSNTAIISAFLVVNAVCLQKHIPRTV